MNKKQLRNARRALIRDIVPMLKTGDVIVCSNDNAVVKFMRFFQKDTITWGHALVVADKGEAWEEHDILENSEKERYNR